MKEKLLFKAVVDLSEVVYDLVGNAHNYSERTAKKMSKALTSINPTFYPSPFLRLLG